MRKLSDGSGLAAVFCIDDLLSRVSRHIAIEAVSEQDEALTYHNVCMISGQR
jgi:hypothetical protein